MQGKLSSSPIPERHLSHQMLISYVLIENVRTSMGTHWELHVSLSLSLLKEMSVVAVATNLQRRLRLWRPCAGPLPPPFASRTPSLLRKLELKA